jgi:hypothetical protein
MNYTVRPPACSFAARTGAPRSSRHPRRCARTTVVRSPAPPVHDMSVPELTALAGGNDPHRARAVLELIGRVRTDDDATDALGELSRLRSLRDDRMFHLVSLAWAAIIGLLAAATERSWMTAHAAFADLDPDDRLALLLYLESTSDLADDSDSRA